MLCIAILRKCGGDHEFRNTYWNKVKERTREQAILLKPGYLNVENWRILVDPWCDDQSNVCNKICLLFKLSICTFEHLILKFRSIFQEVCASKEAEEVVLKTNNNTGGTRFDLHYGDTLCI